MSHSGTQEKGFRTGCYLVTQDYVEKLRSFFKQPNGEWLNKSILGVSCKEEFLEVIAKALNFPDYFGYNLDALEECLRDLEFSNGQKKVLCFCECMELRRDKKLFATLKNLFNTVAEDLKKDGKELMVLFVE